jgi:hypothetical protein
MYVCSVFLPFWKGGGRAAFVLVSSHMFSGIVNIAWWNFYCGNKPWLNR